MRSIVALVVVVAAGGGAVAGGDAPLRLQLAAGRGEANIHLAIIAADQTKAEMDMRLPWAISKVAPDGTASVHIGPPSFSGTAPAWPQGGYAELELGADDRDHDWTTGLPPGAPPGDMERLQKMLSPQYSTGVGIVRLPAAAVKVGGTWSFEEHEKDEVGPIVTRYEYRLLERYGTRIRVAVEQSTRRAGGDKPVTLGTVRGDVAYDLGRPLPVGGWLDKIFPDKRFSYRYH